jgi:hypothetical protein
MPFNRTDMVYNDYLWTVEPFDFSENFKDVEISRRSGPQMLILLNSLMNCWDLIPNHLEAGRMLEITIRRYLPDYIQTYTGIKRWIEFKFPDLIRTFSIDAASEPEKRLQV